MLNTVRNVVILDAGSLASSALTGEPAGLAFGARDMSASVKGHTTNFDGDANALFTYSSPSTKYVRNAAGLLVPGTTMRCDHDASGNKLGLLIEEQRTNLLLRSNEFDNASWSKANSTIGNPTVTANQGNDPGGDALADRVDFPAVGGAGDFSIVTQSITATAATHTGSVYVKALAAGDLGKKIWAYLNNNGTIVATQAVTLTDSYQRLLPSGAFTAGGGRAFSIGVIGSTFGGENQAAVSVLLAYAQLEVGAFPTSYIPTAGSQVTRAADTITLATSKFPLNAAVGTLVVHASWLAGSAVTPNGAMAAALSDTTSSERIILYNISGNAGYAMIDGGSTVATGNNGAPVAANVQAKIGVAYELNNTIGAINGGLTSLDTSCTIPDFTRLNVGSSQAGTTALLNGHVVSLSYRPRRVSDTELQALAA